MMSGKRVEDPIIDLIGRKCNEDGKQRMPSQVTI